MNKAKPLYDLPFFLGLLMLPIGICILFLGGVFSYISLIFIAMVAILELRVGHNFANYVQEQEARAAGSRLYRFLTWSQLFFVFLFMGVSGYLFSRPGVSLFEQVGLVLSSGLCSGAIGITLAHELIHRKSRFERALGGVALAANWYSTFKVEHIRGHHVTVATPVDPSTARKGQSLYHFLPRAIVGNIRNAIRLEARRLHRKGLSGWHWQNELIGWGLLSIGITLLPVAVLGWSWAAFFLSQAIIAIFLLETINYIEHYGLERERMPDGSFEKTGLQHAWNSSMALTNYLMINLQRHSDHHVNPGRRYQMLRHHDASPQLPTGYAGMLMIAMIPPAWCALMDNRLENYVGDRRQALHPMTPVKCNP